MDSKKRLFIAFSIIMILAVAIITSFGHSIFTLTTPTVTLPILSSGSEGATESLDHGDLLRVEVTPRTVQTVIASLSVPESYYRNLQTWLFWGVDNSAQTTVEVWVDRNLTQVQKNLPSAVVRHEILTEDTVYFWYDGDSQYLTTQRSDFATELSQTIPNYQTVLDLEQDAILTANYQTKEGQPCIYVEASSAPLFLNEHYWISTETGLLIASETYDGETLIYRMEGFSTITIPIPEQRSFVLPDGNLLVPSSPEEDSLSEEPS